MYNFKLIKRSKEGKRKEKGRKKKGKRKEKGRRKEGSRILKKSSKIIFNSFKCFKKTTFIGQILSAECKYLNLTLVCSSTIHFYMLSSFSLILPYDSFSWFLFSSSDKKNIVSSFTFL